jgi:hypothetical protein
MTDTHVFGRFSSTDFLTGLTCAAALIGLLVLTLPVLLPRIFRQFAPPSSRRGSAAEVKAALEVQDLRFGWMRTLGTALLTVAVAVGGWAFQQQAARDDRLQRERQSQWDTLSRFLGDMGDSSASKRIAAASYLASRLEAADVDVESSEVQNRLIINAFAYRTTVEDDNAVRDFLDRSIAEAASSTMRRKDVLEAIAGQNRRLRREYVRAVRTISDKIEAAVWSSSQLHHIGTAIIRPLARNANAMFARRNHLSLYAIGTRSDSSDFMNSSYDLERAKPYGLEIDLSAIERQEAGTIRRLRSLEEKIESTTLTLVRALQGDSMHPPPNPIGLNFSETLLLVRDDRAILRNVKLSGVDFVGAIVRIVFSDSTIEFSNLEYADFSESFFDHTDFIGDNLDHTTVNVESFSLNHVSGTNWQFARQRKFDVGYEPPKKASTVLKARLLKQHEECRELANIASHGLTCPWTMP